MQTLFKMALAFISTSSTGSFAAAAAAAASPSAPALLTSKDFGFHRVASLISIGLQSSTN